MRGRQFMGHNYGTAATAELMEESVQDIATSDCQVWRMDVEYYNRTGEVRKLEFIRTEEQPKLTAHKKGAHFVWNKDSGIKGARV